jgi:agmatinase
METPNFGLLEEAFTGYSTSRAVVLPLPFERTTSYGKGTADGPAAIIAASHQVEWYDEELGLEPFRAGIFTAPAVEPTSPTMAGAMEEMEAAARAYLEDGKFLVSLGGEHSLSLGPIRAAAAVHGPLGVVQFDAHADLRDEYEGSPFSHACIMRRVLDLGLPTLAVGIRSLSAPEGELARRQRLPILWGYELEEAAERWDELLEALPDKIYLTFDLDYFDPSLLPATGTPEPGGGSWWPTLRLLRRLFAAKEVVAMDVVELAPRPTDPTSDFVAARLVYKCIGYQQQGRHSGGGGGGAKTRAPSSTRT